jgi:FkbM family methyltransferase
MVPHLQAVFDGEYDVEGLDLRSPLVLDLGANVGAFTLWALQRWPGCEVYAYEPLVENFRLLEANTAAERKRVFPFCKAVRAVAGEYGHLRKGRNNPGEASFFDLGEQTDEVETVRVISPAELPRADVVKLDTEGCELEILEALDLSGVKAVLLEWHRMEDRPAIRELLQPQGFVCVEERPLGPCRGILKMVRGKRGRGNPRVLIASPIYKQAHPQFWASVEACRELPDLDVDFYSVTGDGDVTRARAAILGKYLDEGPYDWFLMVDSDISWHPSVLVEMIRRNLPILGAPYAFKSTETHLAGKAVLRPLPEDPGPNDDGLMPVRWLGGGFILCRDDLVRRLAGVYRDLEFWTNPDHRGPGRRTVALWDPLLVEQPDWGPGKREKLSEDYAFCERVNRLGVTCYVDVYPHLVHWDGDTGYRVAEE